MLQLKNQTPFAAAIALFPNEKAVDTLYTIVKATFLLYPQLSLLPQQPEPQQKDVYNGEPVASSLRAASDFHPGKTATDIILLGSARSPEARPVDQLEVTLKIGALTKRVRVFGDRYWDRGRISTPEPFAQLPLIYENAFGGTLLMDGEIYAEERRNPVGLGFTADLPEAETSGFQLPNLENPLQLITRPHDRPEPSCFAPVAGHWQPRVSYARTYDEAWQRERAPYLPPDYSPRFMNCAPHDQIYPGFLQGGEPVVISGVRAEGPLEFSLPRVNLLNRVMVSGRETTAPFFLETVILQPDELQLSLVWRAALPCDKKSAKVNQVSVTMQR